MAFTKQSVTITRPDAANQPDLVNIAIGNEGYNFSVEDFRGRLLRRPLHSGPLGIRSM